MSLLPTLPPILAEVTSADHPYLLYIVIGAIIAACSAWHHITSGILNMRKLRQDEASEGRDYVTKDQLREVHARVDSLIENSAKARGEMMQAITSLGEKFSDSLRPIHDQMGGIQRSLGRVEGLESIIKEHGADIDALQRAKTAR